MLPKVFAEFACNVEVPVIEPVVVVVVPVEDVVVVVDPASVT